MKATLFLLLIAFAGSERLAGQTNAAAAGKIPTPTAATPDAYRLNVQDKLLFTLREDPVRPAEPEEVFVNAQGKVHFRVSSGFDELITLDAAGKTVAELKAELRQRLLEIFYEQATVELKLKESTQRIGKVLFYGAVRGNFLQLVPGEVKTIFEGVYQVGVTEYANLKKTKLTRLNPTTRAIETRIINLEEIKRGDRTHDLLLQDGDRIEVPERTIVF